MKFEDNELEPMQPGSPKALEILDPVRSGPSAGLWQLFWHIIKPVDPSTRSYGMGATSSWEEGKDTLNPNALHEVYHAVGSFGKYFHYEIHKILNTYLRVSGLSQAEDTIKRLHEHCDRLESRLNFLTIRDHNQAQTIAMLTVRNMELTKDKIRY
jgi:hypothetical protein